MLAQTSKVLGIEDSKLASTPIKVFLKLMKFGIQMLERRDTIVLWSGVSHISLCRGIVRRVYDKESKGLEN